MLYAHDLGPVGAAVQEVDQPVAVQIGWSKDALRAMCDETSSSPNPSFTIPY